MIKSKPLDIPPWQRTAIAEGRCARVTIPREPQPRFIAEADVWDVGEAYLKPSEMRTHLPRWCPFQPGDVLYCAEPFTVSYVSDRHLTFWKAESGKWLDTHGKPTTIPEGKYPADKMPYWLASELRLLEARVTAVSAYLVRDVTPEDAASEGVQVESHSTGDGGRSYCYGCNSWGCSQPRRPDGGCGVFMQGYRIAFERRWNESHPGYSFDTAWGFALEIERAD